MLGKSYLNDDLSRFSRDTERTKSQVTLSNLSKEKSPGKFEMPYINTSQTVTQKNLSTPIRNQKSREKQEGKMNDLLKQNLDLMNKIEIRNNEVKVATDILESKSSK